MSFKVRVIGWSFSISFSGIFSTLTLITLLHLAFLVATADRAASMSTWVEEKGGGHVVMILADQFRYDSLGSWTPSLNRLAKDGVSFTKAYSSTPTCTPARAALLTGLSPWRHGMLGYGAIAQKYEHELAETVDKVALTYSVGKDHFGFDPNSTLRAFRPYAHGYQRTELYEGLVGEPDQYHQYVVEQTGKEPEACWPSLSMNSWRGAAFACDEKLHPTAWTGAKAVEAISYLDSASKKSGGKPFFLKVSFHRPHSPYDPPQRVLDKVLPSDVGLPKTAGPDGWDTRFRGKVGDRPGCGPSNLDAWCGEMPNADAMLSRRAYRASVMFVDEQIGKILDALDVQGLTNSTTILFTADHGDGQGDHNLWRKGYPYEISAHIPFLLRWPSSRNRTPPGSRMSQLVELRDVFPTLLEAIGGDPSALGLDGKSLLALLEDDTANVPQWRTLLDLEHSTCYNETNHWSALTDGTLKFIFHAFTGEKQIFNLTADPYEMDDLALKAESAGMVSEWSSRMVTQFMAEGRGEAWVKDGKLQLRKEGQTYGPNYPEKRALPVTVASPPSMSIPKCPQRARASDFKVSDAKTDVKATFDTLVDICYDKVGFRLNSTAFAPRGVHVSPWTTCNAKVWTEGEVLEFFAAPVAATARDSSPMWYVESDVGTRGALYVGLMNRTAEFNGPHGALDTCPRCSHFSPAVAAGYFSNCSGSDDFGASGNPGYAAKTAIYGESWVDELTVPWSAFRDFEEFNKWGGPSTPPKHWRLNFYRYLYRGPSAKNFELNAWSPTHNPTFHVPERFGFASLI